MKNLTQILSAIENGDLGLSTRAHDKVLCLSRTIADLEGFGEIDFAHMNESIQYRMLDRDI